MHNSSNLKQPRESSQQFHQFGNIPQLLCAGLVLECNPSSSLVPDSSVIQAIAGTTVRTPEYKSTA